MPRLPLEKIKTFFKNIKGKIPRKVFLFLPLFALFILLILGFSYCQKYGVMPWDILKPRPGREKVLWAKKLPSETQNKLKIDRKIISTQTINQAGKKSFGQKAEVFVSNPTNQPLSNVRFVEQIPKEFAKSATDLVFDPQPTVILKDDPEVLYEFEKIGPKETVKIVYKQVEKATEPPEQPEIDELLKAFSEAIESGEPAIDQLPERPKEFTSLAQILKTLAEGKEDEVLGKEYFVHGVVEKAVLLTKAQEIAVDLSLKALGWALDIMIEALPEGAKNALEDIKDAALEAPVKFLTEDLNTLLGDLRIEDGILIGEGKVPPAMLAYNFPNGETPKLEPGRIFAGKVKVVGKKGGPKHLQILPGFWYDDPEGYVPMYELWPNMKKYYQDQKVVTTIGRVTKIEEKEDGLWLNLFLDGRRYLNEIADDITGYTLWVALPKDFQPIPKKNLVLTVTGVIKKADFDLPVEHKKDNRGYLEARGEKQTQPKEGGQEVKEEFPPIFPNGEKFGDEFKNEKTKERCQAYVVKGSKPAEVDNWYFKKMKEAGWEPGYGDQVSEYKRGSATFMNQIFGNYDLERKIVNIPGSRPLASDEEGFLLCWSGGEKEAISTKEVITTVVDFAKLPEDARNCYERTNPIVMKLTPTKEVNLVFQYYYQYEAGDESGSTTIYTDTRRLIPKRNYQLKGCKRVLGTGGPDMATAPGVFFVPKDWDDAILDLEGKPPYPKGITTAEQFLKLPASCSEQITMQLEIIFTFELGDHNDYQGQDETGVIFLTSKAKNLSNGKIYKLKGCKINRGGEELFQVNETSL